VIEALGDDADSALAAEYSPDPFRPSFFFMGIFLLVSRVGNNPAGRGAGAWLETPTELDANWMVWITPTNVKPNRARNEGQSRLLSVFV
jgi:hypothetical protein